MNNALPNSTTRTAADLAAGDTVGGIAVEAVRDTLAVCSTRPGAPKIPAVEITWRGGMKNTLARDVKVAA